MAVHQRMCVHVLSIEWMFFLSIVHLRAKHVVIPLVLLPAEEVLLLAEHGLINMKMKRRRQTTMRIRTMWSLGLRRWKMLHSQLNLLSLLKKHAELAQGTSDVLDGRALQRATSTGGRWLRKEARSEVMTDASLLVLYLVN